MHSKNDYVDIDDCNYPVVVYSFKDHAPNNIEFQEYLDVVLEMNHRSGKAIQLMDATRVSFMTAKERSETANFLREYKDTIQQGTHAYVFVTNTLMTRFMIHAVLQIQPLPVMYRVFDSFEKALKWAKDEAESPIRDHQIVRGKAPSFSH